MIPNFTIRKRFFYTYQIYSIVIKLGNCDFYVYKIEFRHIVLNLTKVSSKTYSQYKYDLSVKKITRDILHTIFACAIVLNLNNNEYLTESFSTSQLLFSFLCDFTERGPMIELLWISLITYKGGYCSHRALKSDSWK